MAENKKRVRPTWTQVRDLEAKLADQIDGTSRLVKDCDLWREKYQKLFAEHKAMLDGQPMSEYERITYEKLKDDNATLRGKVTQLESSNNFMDAELRKVRAELDLEHATADHLAAEVGRLKSRGFWARVFNKD